MHNRFQLCHLIGMTDDFLPQPLPIDRIRLRVDHVFSEQRSQRRNSRAVFAVQFVDNFIRIVRRNAQRAFQHFRHRRFSSAYGSSQTQFVRLVVVYVVVVVQRNPLPRHDDDIFFFASTIIMQNQTTTTTMKMMSFPFDENDFRRRQRKR